MSKFNIEDYFNKTEKNSALNEQNQRYTKYLCKFLSNNGEKLDVSIFASLSIDTLLESLIAYMDDSDSFSKKTANQYIGNLKLLFKYLDDVHQIKNEIYANGNFVPEFDTEAQKIIGYYNDANDKETASEENYKALKSKIYDLENGYSRQEALNGIEEFLYNNSTKGICLYRDILSACATRMVIEFALKNEVIRDLTINDIDLEKDVIKRGKYNLAISSQLKTALSEYLIIRQHLLDEIGKNQDSLFIKSNGEPIASNKAYATDLFEETIKSVTKTSVASEPFARKRLHEMIKAGFSTKTITEITGYKDTTLKRMSELVNDNETEYIQNKLHEFLTNSSIRRKGTAKCVFCGKIKRAIADEWVLVQVNDNETMYLACKDCEGDDGKIKY